MSLKYTSVLLSEWVWQNNCNGEDNLAEIWKQTSYSNMYGKPFEVLGSFYLFGLYVYIGFTPILHLIGHSTLPTFLDQYLPMSLPASDWLLIPHDSLWISREWRTAIRQCPRSIGSEKFASALGSIQRPLMITNPLLYLLS